ncbi:MAG: translation initiation factor IF-2, partial [Candidatus Adiutrix sp.]|nr:translation initiation factor IF-2 [Candidatus Adiutrix sp.]
MGKKRIYELARDLSLTSAELIQKMSGWKLLPGVKLVPSSSVEDYLAEEISRRLSEPEVDSAAGPQVVRRRKKGPDSSDLPGEAENSQPEKVGELEPEQAAAPAPEPVKVKSLRRQPKSEPAIIIATLSPPQMKDAQRHVIATEISRRSSLPDFKKLVPVAAPAAEPESAVEAPAGDNQVPAAPPAPPSALPAAPPSLAPPSVVPPNDRRPAALRKVTREMSESPAKVIGPARHFDAARVVGTKPNWRDTPPNAAAPGGRPSSGEGYRRPSGPAAPDSRGNNTWTPRKPVGTETGRPPGKSTTEFRRPAPLPVAPAPESETSRRRDKKKKTTGGAARFEGDDSAAGKNRRRDVVERTDLYSEGDWERVRRRGKNVKKVKAKTELTVPKAIKRRIKVDEVITVSELAHRLSIKAGDIIKKLMSLGVMAGLNQALDFDTATLVASEFGYDVEKSAFDEDNILQFEYSEDSPAAPRPPVVTIMGHVDHGKTSLLDYIRKTNIQSGEAGGITQHIGAYHVSAGGRQITFLDTPGHEAFTAMRSRGAQVTDIVILIVAADDGVMPQTREAADHAKAAGVPILVAINKIDKPGADVEKVRREMMEIGLVSEAWGGDTVFVEISAKTGQGVAELLDMILLQADILALTARPAGQAKGRIIEARLDKGRGPVATVLVQDGLLKLGDTYVCGVFYGRIRAMLDDQGERVSEAGPAIPVEVQGISGVPQAGDEFIVLEDEKQARQVSQHRLLKQRESELTQTSKLTLENLFDNIKAGAVKGLNLIVKTDVQGSLEAITETLMKLSTPEMKINIIHQSTGAVSETDVMLASASHALVICFGVRPP